MWFSWLLQPEELVADDRRLEITAIRDSLVEASLESLTCRRLCGDFTGVSGAVIGCGDCVWVCG